MNPFTFDDLLGTLHQRIAPWPDHRTGKNTPYGLPDAAVGALGSCFPPSPSWLDAQRTLQPHQGDHTAQTRVGVARIPWDKQGRQRLAPLAPRALDEVWLRVFVDLVAQGVWRHVRGLNNQRWLALDGTTDLSAQTMHGPTGRTRHTANGQPLADHAALTPVVGCPGHPQGIAWPPAAMMPPDGHDTQDGERAAGQRWLATHAPQVAPPGVT